MKINIVIYYETTEGIGETVPAEIPGLEKMTLEEIEFYLESGCMEKVVSTLGNQGQFVKLIDGAEFQKRKSACESVYQTFKN